MECCKVRVKEHPPVYGYSAKGEHLKIFPGEYAVHVRMPASVAERVRPALRFIGANPRGGDIYVPAERRTGEWVDLPITDAIDLVDIDES